MANVEGVSAPAGPRYAPDDPTLPNPWKGLIDGSTGLTYYWNPETNITQYEKPAGAPPPLPSGVSPADTASQSAPQPVTQYGQTAESSQYQQQYMNQLSQHPGQYQGPMIGQVPQQQPFQMPSAGHQVSQLGAFQQHYAHFGQGMSQIGSEVGQAPLQQGQIMQQQYGPPMVQQTGKQMLPSQGPQMVQQPIQQMSQLAGQQAPQHQGPAVGQSQAHHFMPQQMHHAAYHQPMLAQGQQSAQPHSQHMPQGTPFSYQQENRNGSTHQDDSDLSKVKQTGVSMSQVEQSGHAVGQCPPPMNASNHALQASPLSVVSPTFVASTNMHQPGSSIRLQENQNEIVHSHHPSTYQNQMGQSMMHSQQHGLAPGMSKTGYDDNQQVRSGQGYHFNAKNEVTVMAPPQPKLAALPMARNQQDVSTGGIGLHHAPAGHDSGVNAVTAQGMHSMYSHGNVAPPMSNNPLMRPPPMVPGSADVVNISSADAYREQHEVTATGENIPAPFMTFEATGFPPEILRELHFAGFPSPTPIQAQTWPIALESRDIVAIAKTGSGKTLGYLIPAFVHLMRWPNNPRSGPKVLVLAPTRELATQIQEEAIKFGRSSRVSCTCLYGGAPKGPQLEELRRGADIVVATPGRLNDILETKNINVRQVSLLVLDEADRMLDMGFEPQIRKIVNEIPPRRQTLMYTATWPKEVRKIASDLLNNPVQVNIGSVDELAANKSITQYVEVVPQMEKQRRLEQILRSQERGSKVIVFCSTKKLCDELARSIRRTFPAAAIHGDKSQGERDYVLNQFRSGRSPILVATDVAARGLDIKDIRVVINYDFPTGIEDYVHRIGRTGRAGATGVAYTFLSEQDWKYAGDLVKVLEGANQQVPQEVREMALRGGPAFGKDRGGMNRFDSGLVGSGRWDSGGRGGMRDGGGRFGPRDGSFGGRGGMRDGGFGFRGDMRDGGFGGRGGFGGHGMRDGPIRGRGGRSDFSGRGNNRGQGFGGPGGGYAGRPRDEYISQERFNNRDGFGRGRGRGRFDNRRDVPRSRRGRSYSSSPEKVRTWGYIRSSSRSRSRSLSSSRSPRRSYSRSRSRSRSHSPRRRYSRSQDRNHGRSQSPSYDRYVRPDRLDSDQKDLTPSESQKQPDMKNYEPTAITGVPTEPHMPPMPLGADHVPITGDDPGPKFEDKIEPISSGMVDRSDQSASEP